MRSVASITATPRQKHLLIVASGINMVDISGAEMLAREARRRRAMGGGLYIWFMKDAVRELLRKGGYLKDIGEENVFEQGIDVVGALYARLDAGVCRGCTGAHFSAMQRGVAGWRAAARLGSLAFAAITMHTSQRIAHVSAA